MTTWLTTNALPTVLQTYSLLWFCSKLFRQRFSFPLRSVCYLALDVAACLAIGLLCAYVNDSHIAYSFCYTLLVQFLLCTALFSGNPFYKFFYILFTNVFYAGVLMTSIFFAEIALMPGRLLPTRLLYGTFVTLLPQCLAILGLIPLQRFTIRKDFYLTPPGFYWVFAYSVYLAIYFGHIYIWRTLVRGGLVTGWSVLLQLALVVISVAMYLMYLSFCQSYHEKIQYALMRRQYDLQREHLAEMRSSGQALRELRHELKNYMSYMSYLIDQGDFDKLREFFSEFYRKEYHDLYEVSSGDSFLDALLAQKFALAHARGIDVSAQVLLPEEEGRDSFDLCIVLSNLLDNAIEACESLPDAAIRVRLRRVKEYLSLVVENSAARDVLRQNPGLRTSKAERDSHGVGLSVIRQIVERYDGSIQFESDEHSFRALLMLKLPMEAREEAAP